MTSEDFQRLKTEIAAEHAAYERRQRRWDMVINLILSVVTLIVALLWALGVFAAPPPPHSHDAELLAPYGPQIEQAMPDDGNSDCRGYFQPDSCCSTADGVAVDARLTGNGWEIRFANHERFSDAPLTWTKVPIKVVLHCWRNPIGLPIVWWLNGLIRCFAPPSGV